MRGLRGLWRRRMWWFLTARNANLQQRKSSLCSWLARIHTDTVLAVVPAHGQSRRGLRPQSDF